MLSILSSPATDSHRLSLSRPFELEVDLSRLSVRADREEVLEERYGAGREKEKGWRKELTTEGNPDTIILHLSLSLSLPIQPCNRR